MLYSIKSSLAENFLTDGTSVQNNYVDRLTISKIYLINKEAGKSAQEYIEQAIIKQAQEYLKENLESISEISYKLGFKDPHCLSQIFRKTTGISPNKYRTTN